MNRLKELRKSRKLKQYELADEVGIHVRTLLNWEKGVSDIKTDKAQQLANYFGVSVGYLLGYEPDLSGGFETLLEEIKEIRQYACVVAGFNQVFIPESEVISVIEKYIKAGGQNGIR